jgi:hypothetical protein
MPFALRQKEPRKNVACRSGISRRGISRRELWDRDDAAPLTT